MPELGVHRVLLGLTGGIAAYKAAELCRLLVKDGVNVRVVMTDAACRFITPTTMQALSGQAVATDLWDRTIDDAMGHIELSRDRDCIVVAPASADFLAKLANGLADDLLSTLCLARECPLLVAPAMNRQMWENAATRRNVEQLRADGVIVLGPESGDQACGEIGMGRMLEAQQLHEAIMAALQPKVLRGIRILVTAGPTFEAIDPVRGLTNRSSGRMGYAVAQAALEAGAEVVLVSGPTALAAPVNARVIRVTSAQEMLDVVLAEVPKAHVFIAVAAVADYRVKQTAAKKIKKSNQPMTLELEPTVDILGTVSTGPNPPFCVGFAAESHDLDRFADEKRRRKKLPLLAANVAQDAIGATDNQLVLFDDRGKHVLPRQPKIEQARALIAHLAELYKARCQPTSGL
ncbi:MAG TPA: bifunctional phosphopantothenoylcysteine decarboxylase/phosphopantothenate--cysteine ligase CoaBC [Burkholderiales bacterium]|nr:bifunctional phosphopantothenoylcysteine decarboxylase/phosphopantothenate--cysteine ligase CoaBC [Burkholderiales bacterium]